MVKFCQTKEREGEILDLIIESYIEESKPISSAYLCKKHQLSCSTATIRNVMVSLEKQGFLSHIYTSSGRVPTKDGFKHYVENFEEADLEADYPVSLDFCSRPTLGIEDIINYTLDSLVQISGYTSLVAFSGMGNRLFFRGVRYILEQPEFENIDRLKDILYALEVRVSEIGNLLFNSIDDKIRILIGDDIGFEEIADCSLVVSGLKREDLSFAIALLGPMRMNYLKAASCVQATKHQLCKIVGGFV